jgi:hypothetical protein
MYFFWVIQQILISIILIVSLHYTYLFLKNNLTIPKTKDLVKKPKQQYKNILNSISKKNTDNKEEDMKDELKNFIKELSNNKNNKNNKNNNNNNHNISTAGDFFSNSNTNNFSNF